MRPPLFGRLRQRLRRPVPAAETAFDSRAVTSRLRHVQSPEPQRTLILCTDERTGSHHLAQLLAATGVLGRAYEYFNTPWMKEHYDDYPEDVPSQFLWAKRLGTTPNGVLSLKLHPWTMDRIAPFIDLGRDLPAPCFVSLQRRDLLGQAISLHRAQSSQKFTSWSQERATPVYDGARIRALLAELALRRERWDVYFARNGIRPLRIDYEELEGQDAAAVRRVARHVGVPRLPRRRQSGWYVFAKQRDEITEAWRQRFLSEHADTRALDPLVV
ncbi:Stf0 family sulfotransferase [Acidisoma sp. 7E03]